MARIKLDTDDRLNFLSHSQGFYFSACAALSEANKIFEHGGSVDWSELERVDQTKYNGLGAVTLTNGAFAIEICLKGFLPYRSPDTKTGRDYGDYTHNLKALFNMLKSEAPESASEIEKNHNNISCNHRTGLVDELTSISNYFIDARYSHTTPLPGGGSWSKIMHIYTATESALRKLVSEVK